MLQIATERKIRRRKQPEEWGSGIVLLQNRTVCCIKNRFNKSGQAVFFHFPPQRGPVNAEDFSGSGANAPSYF